ncbi:membrane-spanning 4-domains subfamily A member 13 [Arvicanthis niloticus]|uniref:membrane-spanning 4-domains subfamily A member 13 n=1 Tax=Arvicanthis niloticus TaxID=61156 RepID=UPI0014866F53|nr:membrane-spanning 4-domains subfamily A member 13 isoform X3 [Arvicanthis niloticus]
MGCRNSKISSANTVVLGVVQIMIGIYHVFMWYFLLLLYMGQIKGVFGTYEPLTYKMGTSLWGLAFVVSGAFTIKAAKYRTKYMLLCTMSLNILCIIITIIAASLTIVELAHFRSVSYRNYGQAKLGREVSRVLLCSYPLEFGIALTYSISGCSDLEEAPEESLESVTEIVEGNN